MDGGVIEIENLKFVIVFFCFKFVDIKKFMMFGVDFMLFFIGC